ncbi:MAG: hypothetical protein NXH94_14085 [Rhodobacteraceae bacterium]|nr:hypothetical protein [Paracoccaceae bacterium]
MPSGSAFSSLESAPEVFANTCLAEAKGIISKRAEALYLGRIGTSVHEADMNAVHRPSHPIRLRPAAPVAVLVRWEDLETFDIFRDLGHVIPLIVGKIILVRVPDLDDASH